MPRKVSVDGLLLDIAKGKRDFTDCDLRKANIAGHPKAAGILQAFTTWSEIILVNTRSPESIRDAIARNRTTIEQRRLYFTQSDLSGANLRGLPLAFTDLRLTFLDGTDLTGCPLMGATFRDVKAPRCRLATADLRGAEMTSFDGQQVDLAKANLTAADVRHARLARSRFVEANLTGADLEEADLAECDFSGATLRSAKNLASANWRGCLFKRTVVTAEERRVISAKRDIDATDGTSVQLRALRETASRPR